MSKENAHEMMAYSSLRSEGVIYVDYYSRPPSCPSRIRCRSAAPAV